MSEDIFKGVKLVAVVGGKIDSSGLASQSVKVCKVLQVGEADIMVEDSAAYTPRLRVVPKSICIPVRVSPSKFSQTTQSPEVGDLIITFQREDWKAKDYEKIAGIVYGIKYEYGAPVGYQLLIGDEFKTVKNENVLVLQKSFGKKSKK